jgi:hypothetical protein
MRTITGSFDAVYGGSGTPVFSGAFNADFMAQEGQNITNAGSANGRYYLNTSFLGTNYSGSDTHPKNIGLIYCVKE